MNKKSDHTKLSEIRQILIGLEWELDGTKTIIAAKYMRDKVNEMIAIIDEYDT
jgi:hypothetical protein